jgi:hypothetical protein
MQNPFFPQWRAFLAPLGQRVDQTMDGLRQLTLCRLEDRFRPCFSSTLFVKAPAKENSRDRVYNQSRTFWCFLWQCLNHQAPCREVVREVQALFGLHNRGDVSAQTGAYCKARARLPLSMFQQAFAASAKATQQRAPTTNLLQGRKVKLVDGAMLTLPDTPQNQKAYPQPNNVPKNCGFPLLRMVVLFSLASGAILASATGSQHVSETRLFFELIKSMEAQDVVVADQGFGNFVILSLLRAAGMDFIARSARSIGWRTGKRLGKGDRLILWTRNHKPSAILTPGQWASLPQQQTVRVVRGRIVRRGFRTREMQLVTTLLDPTLYPAAEILTAYLRRWRMEMCLDDLKTSLKIEQLRCKTPALIQKELMLNLIAHNLLRWLMVQAAAAHHVPLERISFKGTADALRQFSYAMSQTRLPKSRRKLWEALLRAIAEDLIPDRPGRREPRAIKRLRRDYPKLSQPRRTFRDRPKRNERRKNKLTLRHNLK